MVSLQSILRVEEVVVKSIEQIIYRSIFIIIIIPINIFIITSGIPGGGVSGVQTPPPRNSEGPPKNRAKTQPGCENC